MPEAQIDLLTELKSQATAGDCHPYVADLVERAAAGMESYAARIQSELSLLQEMLRATPLGATFDELYAAQQALQWALEPTSAESPIAMIKRFKANSSPAN